MESSEADPHCQTVAAATAHPAEEPAKGRPCRATSTPDEAVLGRLLDADPGHLQKIQVAADNSAQADAWVNGSWRMEDALSKTGQRLLAAYRHWLLRGICPECQANSLVSNVCSHCSIDWTKEVKDMGMDHLCVGNRIHVVTPPNGVAVFTHNTIGRSLTVTEAPAICLGHSSETNRYAVELEKHPGYKTNLPPEWLKPARTEAFAVPAIVPNVANKGQRVFTKADLLKLHDDICRDAKDLMVLKNQDYSGGTDDPFGNFRASDVVGIDPVAGILLRCLDKFSRLRSFIACGNLVVRDEPVDDIFRDVINYMVLARGMVEEARRLKKQSESP